MADAHGAAVYVESTTRRSQRLVLRHGFTPREPVTIPGGPRMYPSWRPSRASVRQNGVSGPVTPGR
ncbi:hypothetical protein ACFVIM_08375 [Streptomyces sp. NPDC057638]|uniref:hypothetical protein n=1 Tax=Streptomyces sp. NPDC057638 TaxID=3346190 RepID=UPI003680F72E